MKKIWIIITALSFAFNGFAQKADSTKSPKITLHATPANSKEPLIVIDGNKQYLKGTAFLKDINPDNIESMNILKDSSAVTKYGKDGDAGVIEIKTKNGLAGFYNKSIDTNVNNLNKKDFSIRLQPKVEIRNLLQKDTDPKAKPIYIIDGKWAKDIDSLDQDAIKSITVLKDASAKALYGDAAINGVIIVTTKGSKKEPQKKN